MTFCLHVPVNMDKYSSDFIQGDSRPKVNTLGGGSIGHCEKKVHMNMCIILNGFEIVQFESLNVKSL